MGCAVTGLGERVRQLATEVKAAGDLTRLAELEDALLGRRVWRVELRAPEPMRSTNAARRLHWSATSASRAALRGMTVNAAAARALPRGLRRVRVVVTLHFPTAQRRDAGNYHDQVVKPVVDGLCPQRLVRGRGGGVRVEPGYGLIVDDDPAHLDGPYVRIGEPERDRARWPFGRIVVTITDLT